jgi:iron complex transport system substrate-binding protein
VTEDILGRRSLRPRPPQQRPPAQEGTLGRRGALAALLVASAALAALPGCSRAGRASGPPRVVSLSPSTTEAVFAIGAGALLVGRSSYCDYPPEAKALPVVGGFADPSVEKIVALRPTLVVGARGPAGPPLAEALERHGIPTYFPETESIAQIEAMLTGLGERLGRDAKPAIATIEAARAKVSAAIVGKPRVRAVFLFDAGPIVAAGPGSFPDELIRQAGGVNLITAGGQYPMLDIERVLALDPDVILDGAAEMGAPPGTSRLSGLRDAPGWSRLRAMREGRVRPISASTALRPGPRIGAGLIAVARALHGDSVTTGLPGGAAP